MEKKGFKVTQAESVKNGINLAKKLVRMYLWDQCITKDSNKWLVIRFMQEGQVDPKIC